MQVVVSVKAFRRLMEKTDNLRNVSVHGDSSQGNATVKSCLLEKVRHMLL